MSRRRFYVPPEKIHHGVAELPPDQAHRLRDVLRLRNDRDIEVFDGSGNAYVGRLGPAGRRMLIVDLKPITERERVAPRLVVAAAIIKPARFEWMLEKATELGADEFIPLMTRYSDLQPHKSNLDSRFDRWQRIVCHASEQSGRAIIPQVHVPSTFPDFLGREDLFTCTRLLCYENGGVPLAREKCSGPVVLCTGPEGGWEAAEVDAAVQRGYKLVSLGRNTLRAETSVIAAVTLIRIAN